MKARAFVWGLAAALCALPLLAQDIPAGDDVWDSLGAGATEVTLSPAQWSALCGASVGANTAVQLKGYNIPGQGTGDTIVRRLDDAILPGVGSSASVRTQLVDLSMVSDGSHPCSPRTLRVVDYGNQAIGSMTITKTSDAGGTFSAQVKVSAVISTTDGSGNPVFVSGTLGDDSASPWSYAPPTSAATTAAATPPWHPGVDPTTGKPVRTCRRGNKTLPARHCYQPPPPCGGVVAKDPVAKDAADSDPVLAEQCTFDTDADTEP